MTVDEKAAHAAGKTLWQDYVIAALQVCFTLFLIPTIFGDNKPEFWTAILNVLGIIVFCATVATLKLRLTAALMAVNGVAWALLAYQAW